MNFCSLNNQRKTSDKLESQIRFVDKDPETSSQSEWEDIPSSKVLASSRNKVQNKKKNVRQRSQLKKIGRCKPKSRHRSCTTKSDVDNDYNSQVSSPEHSQSFCDEKKCCNSVNDTRNFDQEFSENICGKDNENNKSFSNHEIEPDFYDPISFSNTSSIFDHNKLFADFETDKWNANSKKSGNIHGSPQNVESKEQAFQATRDTNSDENETESDNENETESDNDLHSEKLEGFIKKLEKQSEVEKRYKPLDFIIYYCNQIEMTANEYFDNHVEIIRGIKSLMSHNKTCYSVFAKRVNNLQLQLNEFEAFVNERKNEITLINFSDIGHLIKQAKDIYLKTKIEGTLFKQIFPAYGYKSQFLNALKENQVIIVSSDCSYFFNLVCPIILESYFPDHFILCYEENDLAYEYGRNKINSIIRSRGGNVSKINHVTDDDLIRFLSPNVEKKIFSSSTEQNLLKSFSVKKKEFESKDFIAVVNIPLKRSVNLDLSIALLQKLLLNRKHCAVVLIMSQFDFPGRFEKYFSKLKTYKLEVPTLIFPVRTVWKKGPSESYKEDVVKTALSVCFLNGEGNILALLPTEEEAEFCKNMFLSKYQSLFKKDIEIVLLQENSSLAYLDSLKDVREKRTIFFSTDIAEGIIIPSVQYVIDCGLKKGYVFDKKKNTSVLKTEFVSRAKARMRKSLPCVHNQMPVCYRTYNKENFCYSMPPHEYPDILTIDPFDYVLKIYQYAQENPETVKFVQPLDAATMCNTIKKLEHLKAVKDGKLSPLGEKIIKLPLPVQYSKFINQCMGWGYAFEAIVIVAYFLTDSSVFKHSEDKNFQKVIDETKFEFLVHGSDALSFLQIYKHWVANDCSKFWCDSFYIDYETLTLIQSKVSKMCQYVSKISAVPISEELQENDEVVPDITQALLYSFSNTFSVFSGHHRSGYRILSSSVIGFIDPSSLFYNNKNKFPQFLIFNKISYSSRNFIVGITALDQELVMDALTPKYDKILNYDTSDIFDKFLMKKSIERVSERNIRQNILGRKGKKLVDIENIIESTLNCSPVVVEPILNDRCIDVYAPSSYIDMAVEIIQQIIDDGDIKVLSSIREYILELKRGKITLLLEIQCSSGAKVESFTTPKDTFANDENHLEVKPSYAQYSLNLSWVRRTCIGICYIEFSKEEFKMARKLSTKYIRFWKSEVYIDVSTRKNNELLWTNVPPEAREKDIEDILREMLPHVKNPIVCMMFSQPFISSNYDTKTIKSQIEEICKKCTKLSYKVTVPVPQDTDNVWEAYIDLFSGEDLIEVHKHISDIGIGCHKVMAKPVYKTKMKISLEIFTALEIRLLKEISELKLYLAVINTTKDIFSIERISDFQDMQLNLICNDFQVLKQLAKTVNYVFCGEVIDKNIAYNINLLFCHGGQIFLKKLQKYQDVFILEEYSKQIIRLYGSAQICLDVKQAIVRYLENIESETVPLNIYGNTKQFLKAILHSFGVDLIYLIDTYALCHTELDLKSNLLLLQGYRESINKAKQALSAIAETVPTHVDVDLLIDFTEKCLICDKENDGFFLQNCNHIYCQECFIFLVMQSSFPIQCCAQDCEEDLSLIDIEKFFANDRKRKEKLFMKSWNDYIEENRNELIDCPMPGCPFFFKKSDFHSSVVCPLCKSEVCTICKVVCNALVCNHG